MMIPTVMIIRATRVLLMMIAIMMKNNVNNDRNNGFSKNSINSNNDNGIHDKNDMMIIAIRIF